MSRGPRRPRQHGRASGSLPVPHLAGVQLPQPYHPPFEFPLAGWRLIATSRAYLPPGRPYGTRAADIHSRRPPEATLESWYSHAGGGFAAGKPAVTFANPWETCCKPVRGFISPERANSCTHCWQEQSSDSSSIQATPRGGPRARSPIPVVIFLTPLSLNSKIKRIDRPTFLLLAPY